MNKFKDIMLGLVIVILVNIAGELGKWLFRKYKDKIVAEFSEKGFETVEKLKYRNYTKVNMNEES